MKLAVFILLVVFMASYANPLRETEDTKPNSRIPRWEVVFILALAEVFTIGMATPTLVATQLPSSQAPFPIAPAPQACWTIRKELEFQTLK